MKKEKSEDKEKEILNKEEIKELKKDRIKRYLKNSLVVIIMSLMVVIVSKVTEDMYFFDRLKNFSEEIGIIINIFTLLNLFLVIGLFFILKSIFKNTKLSFIILISITFIFNIVNYFVYTKRGVKLAISDLFSFKTAMNVSRGLVIELPHYLGNIIMIFIIAIIIILLLKTNEKNNKKNILKEILERAIYFAVGVSIIALITITPYYKEIILWNINDSYIDRGTGMTILKQFSQIGLKKPKDYNSEYVQKKLEELKDDDFKVDVEKPNIIIVVNESFTDLYDEYNLGNRDSIPYFRNLLKEENIVSGTMYSSEFGGGTANIEYEFLTQNTTFLFPTNAVIFNQYIRDKKDSIVSYMKNLGYYTVAIHGWWKSGYNREIVYKYFDFDETIFYEDREDWDLSITTEYPTDKTMYEKLIEKLELKDSDKPLFYYILTMQNHREYFRNSPLIDDFDEDVELNCYLEALSDSDNHLEYLINYLKNFDEKTIVLFFGDHQPRLESLKLEKGYTKDNKVPFMIWANYDIEEKNGIDTSTIFLQNYLIDVVGFPKTSYMKYMENLRKVLPVITKEFYMDSEGNSYVMGEDSKYKDLIDDYGKMIYYMVTK